MKRSPLALTLTALLVFPACHCTTLQQRHIQTDMDSASQSHHSLLGNYEFSSGGDPGDVYIAITVSRSASDYVVSFQAGHPNAHGAAPDGEGVGRIGSDGILRFSYEDSFSNRGSGIFRRTLRGYELLIDITDVADPRCMMFYGDFTLERVDPKTATPHQAQQRTAAYRQGLQE